MIKGELPFESLHNHTVISDGRQTHGEVLAAAEAAGFGLISFTDHDILPHPEDMNVLQDYDGPVEWNVGIEISSGLPRELGGGPATLFHILGLDIDHTHTGLNQYCNDATEARFARLEATVSNLKTLQFDVELGDCLEIAGDGTPGTPHLSRALLAKEGNIRRLEAIAEDMRQKSMTDPQLAEKYQDMMLKVERGQRHPYTRELLLSDGAYLPDIYVPYLFSLEMDETVRLIRAAGGVAIIAHWPAAREVVTERHLERIAAEQRIDGLELRTVFDANPTIEQDMAYLKDLATQHSLHTTVGVDGHEPNDFEKFIAIPGAAEMTVGQWEHITPYK